MTTFEWKKKRPAVDYFGECTGFNFVLQGTDSESGKTESANLAVIFGGDDIKHIDEWSQQEIDDLAEEKRISGELETEIERRLANNSE